MTAVSDLSRDALKTMIHALDEQAREIDRRMQETNRRVQETDRLIRALREQRFHATRLVGRTERHR